jgi:capsular exopolysaccharide synthesis family protein
MSLIEQALRRAAAKQAGGQSTRRAPITDTMAVVSPTTAAAAPNRVFRSCTLDTGTLERNHVLPKLPDVAAQRAYKVLRTRVLQRMGAEKWQSVAVTGTASGEGKTLTAVNLAIALAQDMNTSAFLIDMDLQRPRVAACLGMNADKGLSDYLTGQANIEDIIYDPGIDRLAVIPNTQALQQSSELLSSPRMVNLLKTLIAEVPKRIIVVDTPPLTISDDVLAVAPHIDSFLMVVAQGQTVRSTLESAKETLASMNLLGVVLNRSPERDDSPYYY